MQFQILLIRIGGEGAGEGGDRKPRQRRFNKRRGPFGGGGQQGGRGFRRGPRRSENGGDGVNGECLAILSTECVCVTHRIRNQLTKWSLSVDN